MKKIKIKHRNTYKYVLVDDEDYHEWFRHLNWRILSGYAVTGNGGVLVYMHHLVLLIKRSHRGTDIDHINGNKLDNRSINLRVVSHKENCNNRHKK